MPKACDACQSCTAVVYCRADAAYLCASCDGNVHGANKLASRHERVWMCEVCEFTPAVVTCRADAAALCIQCDADIHSANPLARRHERVPIMPFYECAALKKGPHVLAAGALGEYGDFGGCAKGGPGSKTQKAGPSKRLVHVREEENEDDDAATQAEAASWLQLPGPGTKASVKPEGTGGPANSGKNSKDSREHPAIIKTEDDLFSEVVAPYLDIEYASAMAQAGIGGPMGPPAAGPHPPMMSLNSGPVGNPPGRLAGMPRGNAGHAGHPGRGAGGAWRGSHPTNSSGSFEPQQHYGAMPQQQQQQQQQHQQHQQQHQQAKGYQFHGSSLSGHSMSSSSMDVGVVPDSAQLSDTRSFDSGHPSSAGAGSGSGNGGVAGSGAAGGGPNAALAPGVAPPDNFEYPRMLHVGAMAPLAREARVMRYKEKRKLRKFEKTIRYASRKTYAESRPRVKGRFARRSDDCLEGEDIGSPLPSLDAYHVGLHSYSMGGDPSFSVVPNF